MKLKEYLARLDESQLKQIGQCAAADGVFDVFDDGRNMAEALLSRGALQALLDTMPRPERETWQWIVRRVGMAPFTLAELDSIVCGRLTGAQLAVSAVRLCKKGLLARLRNKRGDLFYAMPADLFELSSGLVRSPFFPATEIAGEVMVTTSVSVDLARQLFTLLVFIRFNPVRITRSGEVPKRVADKIEGLFGVMCDDPAVRTAELLDIGFSMKLLRIESGLLGIDEHRVQLWNRQSAEYRNLALYEYWKSGHMPESVAVLHAMYELQRFPVWQWFPLAQLIQSLAGDGIIEDVPAAMRKLAEWMKPPADFGWLDLGETGNGAVCRLRTCLHNSSNDWPTGDDSKVLERRDVPQWVVQPDYEVLVPPGVPFSALWELELMAERIRLDSVCLYKLTKESIQRAAVAGRNAGHCLECLVRHALYEIPENVILGINRWFSGFVGRQSDDAVDLRDLPLSTPEFFTAFEEVLPVIDSSIPDGYEVVVKLPEEEELFRKWRDVPPLWIKQSRPYHLSVRKQIVRQAIEWQTAIELGQGNKSMTVQPMHIDERSGEACFVARIGEKKETIGLDSWERIRLLLPGVNEQ
jgi:hypothetical protein